MFRTTTAGIGRADALLTTHHPPDDVVHRLASEGMPRERAEWLVRRAGQERRSARAGRVSIVALVVALLAVIAGIVFTLYWPLLQLAVASFAVVAAAMTPPGRIRDSSLVPWSVFRRLNNGQTIVVSYLNSPMFISRPFSRRELGPPLMLKIAGFQLFAGLFLIVFITCFGRVIGRTRTSTWRPMAPSPRSSVS